MIDKWKDFFFFLLSLSSQQSLERNKTLRHNGMYTGRCIYNNKNLYSQTFLDCFTTWRKPYSQCIAQRLEQKGDSQRFLQSLDSATGNKILFFI